MPFSNINGLKIFTFSSFEKEVRHGIFTREGGLSPKPWNSLNMGGTVGDDRERVIQNRLRAFSALKLDPKSLFEVWQVHGTTVALANSSRAFHEEHQKADIILTDQPNITLMMRFADCTPILLYDSIQRIIGLVHAGWKGTVNKAAKVAVDAMINKYGSKPENIRAAIGPSIGPDHYEIGPEVAAEALKTFEKKDHVLIEQIDGKIHFDLWEGNRILLHRAGVEEIEVAALCTACNLNDWYSHRAEKGITGRFGLLASLESRNEL